MNLSLNDFEVIYEDNHLIAVNKPAGWLVQGDQTGDTPLSEYVKEYIKIRYKKEGNVFLGVIHRLDRPVSGVVVFARTSKGLSRMNKLFQENKVQKTYWAITKERPAELESKLVHYLVKDNKRNLAKALDKPSKRNPNAKRSELSYNLIGSLGNFHLLEVKPKTGRPHQIRVQLARIGCSIKGDLKYGFPQANLDGSIHLHAKRLEFEHPVKKVPVIIEAEPPSDQVWDKFS
ncbi:MAG: RNA pseudouridine synthase [Bacteroidota bacterium]